MNSETSRTESLSGTLSNNNIGEKLAVLAKSRGLSQGQLAKKINISRVSINRFFKGKSSIRTCDLVQLLQVLDIDLESLISQKLEQESSEEPPQDIIYKDMISIIDHLDEKARSSVIEQIAWWGKCVVNEKTRQASERLHSALSQHQWAG